MNYYYEVTRAVGLRDFSDKEMIGAILGKLETTGFVVVTIAEI